MPGELVDICDTLNGPCRNCSATDTLADCNLHASDLPLKRSENEFAAVHEIKARPVQSGQF